MTTKEGQKLLEEQRAYFHSAKTLSVKFRIGALKKLLYAVEEQEDLLCEALKKDLGKSRSESYMCEIGLVKSEIRFCLRHIRRWTREKRVKTPLAQFPSRSFLLPSPKGNVLIMSPWNYPVLLTLSPLANAICAGNTAVLKPSAYSPHTTKALKKLIEGIFPAQFVSVVTGGRAENQSLLELPFHHIFFTGSVNVGKEVMAKAAQRLIPVTLELGGKSPCIVDASADISLAAKRIVFGKFINCGQTCVAPDYILCDRKIEEKLIAALKKEIEKQYGTDPLGNPEYGKIISQKHFERLLPLIDRNKICFGGKTNAETLQIEPTLLRGVTRDDNVMKEEIFGPILPIIGYDSLAREIEILHSLPSPLALYHFSSDKKAVEKIKTSLSFGGGCINDTLIHLATSALPFGGVGESGMGSYHGRRGFECFSHFKSIVDKKTFLDLPMRYAPHTKTGDTLIRIFVR